MDRINGQDTVDIGGGRRGFQGQNAAAGIPGTEVTAAYLNGVQEEIMAVIENAGLTADPNDWSQLWKALNSLTLPGNRGVLNWLAVRATDVVAPPANARTGDTYLIPANATGAWQSHRGQIAVRDAAGWIYITPRDGHGFALPSGDVYIRCNGVYLPKIALDVQSGKWLFGSAAGNATAMTVNLAPPVTQLTDGLTIRVKIASWQNAADATINLNGLGPRKIFKSTGTGLTTLKGGEMQPGGIYSLVFNTVLDNTGGWFFAAAAQDNGPPAGQVDMFAMSNAPEGWLECDGRALSRTGFPALFRAVGTVWGAGNGSTTFNIPDFRGVFLRGWGLNQRHDVGRKFAQLQVDAFQSHSHPGSKADPAGGHDHDFTYRTFYPRGADGEGGWSGIPTDETKQTSRVPDHNHLVTITPEGGNETRPINQTVVYAIKT